MYLLTIIKQMRVVVADGAEGAVYAAVATTTTTTSGLIIVHDCVYRT